MTKNVIRSHIPRAEKGTNYFPLHFWLHSSPPSGAEKYDCIRLSTLDPGLPAVILNLKKFHLFGSLIYG